ncbi:thiol:disulfide interchange protein DsbD [Lacibacter cauensis]|uniref:Thiol:disulfide interchange protein DsbD n=2 Tax=Lacibacter cauensis TaxID=510947 RepID=A0A562SYR8_9BACT|nr:thiol:disulfide interchange protein DsbD [Lacibacter cauensis]
MAASSQSSVIKWTASAVSKGDNIYELSLTGTINKGWYVYARSNNDDGLESLSIQWDYDSINAHASIQFATPSNKINDRIFQKSIDVYSTTLICSQLIKINGQSPRQLKVNVTGFASNGDEFLPIDDTISFRLQQDVEVVDQNRIKLTSIKLDTPVAVCGEEQSSNKGILTIFFIGFLGGLIALLTPCVFPMIPVTVSFFINKSSSKGVAIRNAATYGVFILLVYLLASIPFHLFGDINPEIFNSISTNTWLNLFFFIVFLAFALSFFGLFNIQLPSAIANTADSKSSIKSVAGIFFMALTIAIVSFSCTGPILGSLLVTSISAEGGAWQLTAGMAGFGLALGLPFALFAMFPNWIQRLPKSGGWLNTVKKSLAFIELALAIKFLSNADLVNHWGILKREIFIGAWVIIALSLAIYLFNIVLYFRYGKFNLSAVRIVFGVMALAFALYLIPGVTKSEYAKLSLLSGFPPPLEYSIYKDRANIMGTAPPVINDYEKALALSKKTNKPLLIDFTGWACVNCRKMEELVWTDPSVMNYMKEHFIMVSLYVDDRKKLPAKEQRLVQLPDGTEKEIKTVGERWSLFQAINFKQVTQPLYVILSKDEQLLNHPIGYTADVKKYKEWLECGVKASRMPL